jgi:hypothetical protein
MERCFRNKKHNKWRNNNYVPWGYITLLPKSNDLNKGETPLKPYERSDMYDGFKRDFSLI